MRYLRVLMVFALAFALTAVNLYAAEYVAFSLRVAQERITESSEGGTSPEVSNMGGITVIRGLVYDRENRDVILVGEKDPDRSTLTLDDFVVALRARFIHGKWPLVSIDPTEETKKTEMQIVRFEGGIQNSQFGKDLFDADYKLKQMGMGLISPSVVGVKTYWDLSIEQIRTERAKKERKINSRFWFYPIMPSVAVRQDVVAIGGLKVGVFTEVLYAELDGNPVKSLTTFHDAIGDEFARYVSERYEELSRVHPSFARVWGLNELVALTRALESMDNPPELTWWLKEYSLKEVDTEKEIEVLRRKYGYQTGAIRGWFELAGGVELRAIALRLKAGDVTALREAVLKTRPRGNPLSWTFSVEDWGIVGPLPEADMNSVAELYAHGEFLFRQKKYDLAIAYWRRILQIIPDIGEIYYRIGQAFERKGLLAVAADYYSKALDFDPFLKNLRELRAE